MDWATMQLLLSLVTMLPMILLLCKAGKPKEGGGAGEDGLSTVSTMTTKSSSGSNAGTDVSGTASSSKKGSSGSSDKERSTKVEGKDETKKSPLNPMSFHKEIVVPIGKASVETPMKSNMSKRENRKKDSSRSSKRVVRFK